MTMTEATLTTPALTGPAFGSYNASEVTWLLKDLSHAEIEAPLEEREEAIQAGVAHYAESLPVEFQPDEAYCLLFEQALAEKSRTIATAVAKVSEQVKEERGENLVLVSLARAGTPIGILMRRYAMVEWGVELPHYAVSIVRGKGIDYNALDYIARNHDSAQVLFVDGWTGKGAITKELAAAVDLYNVEQGTSFNPELAVLADPAYSVKFYGTREDYLIPSACLNSTVSGLVSRTVLNDELIGPNDFHGAKFYNELSSSDYSNAYLDAVSAHFSSLAEGDKTPEPADDNPQWSGWELVERVSKEYGINSVNLVKPGVGETTRVLLRRVPWKILFDPTKRHLLNHVFDLAEKRGVDMVPVDNLVYSCIGLIKPNFTTESSNS